MSYSYADLVRRHYGSRPDPNAAPAAYARWLRAAQVDTVRVGPGVAAKHLPRGGSGSSTFWSGCETTNNVTFDEVGGEWHVPGITVQPSVGLYYYFDWVGISGAGASGSPPLLQAGNYGVQNTRWSQRTGTITILSYFVAAEYYPNNPITGFPVSPGDDLSVYVFQADANGNVSASGQQGWFVIQNFTHSAFWDGPIAMPSGSAFNGQQASWIMEAPGFHQYSLANYGSMDIFGAWSVDTTFGVQYLHNQPLNSITMG